MISKPLSVGGKEERARKSTVPGNPCKFDKKVKCFFYFQVNYFLQTFISLIIKYIMQIASSRLRFVLSTILYPSFIL